MAYEKIELENTSSLSLDPLTLPVGTNVKCKVVATGKDINGNTVTISKESNPVQIVETVDAPNIGDPDPPTTGSVIIGSGSINAARNPANIFTGSKSELFFHDDIILLPDGEDEYKNITDEAIRTRFAEYFQEEDVNGVVRNLYLNDSTVGYINLDWTHPQSLGGAFRKTNEELTWFVQGVIRRINILREFIPNAKLSIWRLGDAIPALYGGDDGTEPSIPPDEFENELQKTNLLFASNVVYEGTNLFDSIDFLSPVFYQYYEDDTGPDIRIRNSVRTRNTIDNCNAIFNSHGETKPVIPILAFTYLTDFAGPQEGDIADELNALEMNDLREYADNFFVRITNSDHDNFFADRSRLLSVFDDLYPEDDTGGGGDPPPESESERIIIPEGLNASYDESTVWNSFATAKQKIDDGGDLEGLYYRPTLQDITDAIDSAAKPEWGSINLVLSKTYTPGDVVKDGKMYGCTSISELGGEWIDSGTQTDTGTRIWKAELLPGTSENPDRRGIDILRYDQGAYMYPVDPFIASSNQNCPPVMQVTPKVADYRRMFTIAVDRTSVIPAMHSAYENEQFAGIGTQGDTAIETGWNPNTNLYVNPVNKSIRTIKWFTPNALNSAGKVDGADGSLTENISKTKFEESISEDQLNGLELFMLSQHCGPNVMISALCKYERDATGGNDEHDELEYKGVITVLEWDHGKKKYINGSKGSYYNYVRIAMHGDKNTLRDNEWCIQYKLDGTIIMHYAPIYEDDVDASPEKRLMVPVLATLMYTIGEGTLTNMEIIGCGRLGSSAPGAVKMANGAGNMMNLDRLKILFNDAGINGSILSVTNTDIAWACSRTLAASAPFKIDPLTGAATVIKISNNTFRFSQIMSLISVLCNGPPSDGNIHRASPPIEVEGNLFYLPITCHGQCLSLYKGLYQNAHVHGNVIIDCTRAMSFQDGSDNTVTYWDFEEDPNENTKRVIRSTFYSPAIGIGTNKVGYQANMGDSNSIKLYDDYKITSIVYLYEGDGKIQLGFEDNAAALAFGSLDGSFLFGNNTLDETEEETVRISYSDGTGPGGGTVITYSAPNVQHRSVDYGTRLPIPVSVENLEDVIPPDFGGPGFRLRNNLFIQKTAFDPPAAGQAYIAFNGAESYFEDTDDEKYLGRFWVESNTVIISPTIFTDPDSPASDPDSDYNQMLGGVDVSPRVHPYGMRPIVRNNIADRFYPSRADDPNPVTGWDGSDSETEPRGSFMINNASLDFYTWYKDRFPNHQTGRVEGNGYGHNDLLNLPLDKFEDNFDINTFTTKGIWAESATDGNQVGIRWNKVPTYDELRLGLHDWRTVYGVQEEELPEEYKDTDGVPRGNDNSDYVISRSGRREDFRIKTLSSVNITWVPAVLLFTGEEYQITSDVVSAADVSYEWTLDRSGEDKNIPFGTTIIDNVDSPGTATLSTGTFNNSGESVDDLIIKVKVVTTSGQFAGWESVSDEIDEFTLIDNQRSGLAVPNTGSPVGNSDNRYYRSYAGGSNPFGISSFPEEFGDRANMIAEFRMYNASKTWSLMVFRKEEGDDWDAFLAWVEDTNNQEKIIKINIGYSGGGTENWEPMNNAEGSISFKVSDFNINNSRNVVQGPRWSDANLTIDDDPSPSRSIVFIETKLDIDPPTGFIPETMAYSIEIIG